MSKFRAVATKFKPSLELFWVQYGKEECLPLHKSGPSIKDHFIMHFILKGKGQLTTENGSYNLKKGQAFVLFPNEVLSYEADKDEPWEYIWIGINGSECSNYLKLCDIDEKNPVTYFDVNGKIPRLLSSLLEIDQNLLSVNFAVMGKTYSILAELVKKQMLHEKKKDILKDALEYIEKNYSTPISIDNMAKHLFISRSHLYKIFKDKLNVSPQQYVINFKLVKASEFLRLTNFQVSYIAEILCFDDISHFCKLFKRKFKVPPLQYRLLANREMD